MKSLNVSHLLLVAVVAACTPPPADAPPSNDGPPADTTTDAGDAPDEDAGFEAPPADAGEVVAIDAGEIVGDAGDVDADAGDVVEADAGVEEPAADAGEVVADAGEVVADAGISCGQGLVVDGDGCALGEPPQDMMLWLDADDSSSVTLAASGDLATTFVEQWADKRGEFPRTFAPPADANQPKVQTNALNGRRVIRFDGVDDFLVGGGGPAQLIGSGDFENVSAYTIFVVGYASAGAQVLVAGQSDDTHGLLLQSEGAADFRFLHRTPLANTAQPTEDNLVTTDGDYSRLSPQLVTAIHDETTHALAVGHDGAAIESRTTTADPFGESLQLILGRLKKGATASPRHLDGDLAEIIIYERALTADEMAEVRGYLTAKWGLAPIQ